MILPTVEGLEFMGKDWDAPWKGKASKEFNTIEKGSMGGFTKLPNHARVNNTKCLVCDKWKFSGTPCTCANPIFPNARKMAMEAFEDWSVGWLEEAYRVLKPNGVVRSFCGTRTYHRLVSAMHRAGFAEVSIETWHYFNGFPKSLNVSKDFDRIAGAEREVVGWAIGAPKGIKGAEDRSEAAAGSWGNKRKFPITKPKTKEAIAWDGWHTALKPSFEPVVVGYKK